MTCSLAGLAPAQPTYFARGIAGLASYGDGGSARSARLIEPAGLTADAAGNTYVAEAAGAIRRIAPDGRISTIAGQRAGIAQGDGGPAVNAGFSVITGIVASGNYLYVAQQSPCNIRRIDLATRIVANFAGTGACADGPDGPAAATTLNFPRAIAADWQGRIYVAEQARVRRIDPGTGEISAFAGNGTPGFAGDGGGAADAQLNAPAGIAAGADGDVYINDSANCRIRRVARNSLFISTVVGSGTCGNAGDGGLAINAQLSGIGALALDPTGSELYMASGSVIRLYSIPSNTIDRFAGTGGAGPVRENLPALEAALWGVSGIHADAAGNVLLSDPGANRIAKVAPNGLLTTFAGALPFAGDNAPAQYAFLTLPTDVLPEPDGGLLISDNVNRRVRRRSPQGMMSTLAGTGAPGGASGNAGSALNASIQPAALARDASGNIYAADVLSNAVRRIAINRSIAQIGPTFEGVPGGIAVDADEIFLYIADTAGHRIVRVSISTGETVTFAGTGTQGFAGDNGPALQARLNAPMRLAFGPDGWLYVADSGNHRIRKISPNGDRIETVAGNGSADGAGDGSAATQASLPSPIGVAVDAGGNIVTNNAASVYRVDKASGTLRRIAGQTQRGNSALSRPALDVAFNSVGAVALDERGTVYFAEPLNLRIVALTPSTSLRPAITTAIVPGAFGGGDTLTPHSWVEIYGEKLSSVTREWQTGDFNGLIAPVSLGGVRVLIQGVEAHIQFVSPTQINAVVPAGALNGEGIATVQVVNANGASDAVSLYIAPTAGYLLAPPLFSRDGKQYPVAFFRDGGGYAGPRGLIPGSNVRPANSASRLTLYGIGFGPVSPIVPAGTMAPSQSSLPNVVVRIAGIEAAVQYAGVVPGYVGLYQFDIIVPNVPPGDDLLEIVIDGRPLLQTLYIHIE